ncbi:MAG: phosphoesterase [Clostridia bacterium]|nr:phosphoesterase [Clostridia bacterium]
MSSNKKVFETLVSRTKVYLIIILILLVILCINNKYFIIPSIVIYVIIMAYTYFANNKRKSEISETLQDLTLTVDSAAKSTLINSPLPLIILETDGNIIWRSSKFVTEFANVDINNYINDLIIETRQDIEENRGEQKSKTIKKEMQIGTKTYKILGEFVKSKNNLKKKKSEYMLMIYFMDQTENIKLQNECNNSKTCVGVISVDNYDETMQRIATEKRPEIIAQIEKNIYEWTGETNGIIVKPERDTYVCLFEKRYLEKLKENKFSILDTIKELGSKEKIQLTLSIAISDEGATNKEKYKNALETMDVILGRGGDQAAIRQNNRYQFFGGRVEEVEKRTKVKARVVAHALEKLIREAENIVIMGHANPDIDAIGSALGVYRIATALKKKANIVTDKNAPAIKSFIEELSKEEGYETTVIDRETGKAMTTENTLVVLVDTHKRNYVEEPEILTKTSKIVIIDHHRRSADYVENATLTFQEVYASSAAELVTELIQYVEGNVELKLIEAEGLYAGIMVDTKNFTFKTGVRTFEAAAYLRKYGVDIIKIKKWFQSDLEGYNKIAEIVKNAEVIRDTIAISIYKEQDREVNLMCAKAADELLTIGNITASFVLGLSGEKVMISGRSIGDINVQLILEKLGGGGHINLAGAQIEGLSIEEVRVQLIDKIDEYFNEENK